MSPGFFDGDLARKRQEAETERKKAEVEIGRWQRSAKQLHANTSSTFTACLQGGVAIIFMLVLGGGAIWISSRVGLPLWIGFGAAGIFNLPLLLLVVSRLRNRKKMLK